MEESEEILKPLEITSSFNAESDSLDRIRLKILEVFFEMKNIFIQKDYNYFKKTLVISFIYEAGKLRLNNEDYDSMISMFNLFHKSDFFITSSPGKVKFFKKILRGTPVKTKVIDDNFLVISGRNLEQSQKDYIIHISDSLPENIYFSKNRKLVNKLDVIENIKPETLNFDIDSEEYLKKIRKS